MELTADHHKVAEEYIHLIWCFRDAGIDVAVIDEEYTYDILSECFSTNEVINEYLRWAVRIVKSKVGTIEETLKNNTMLFTEIIQAEKVKHPDLYHRFFSAVRGNKEYDDNLGEELIAVCVHILSHLPGIHDGKLCVITDDKGAAIKIDSSMKKTASRYGGAKIILFSTPKLVQNMFRENVLVSEEQMINMLSCGATGNIVVMGTTTYDLEVKARISLAAGELAQKIKEQNGIHIIF